MKLYTEEQVVEMIEKSRLTGLTADYLILTTTPIDLPSNELILIAVFRKGAKWIREQILNSCKKCNS
jgi:hypothetical protein